MPTSFINFDPPVIAHRGASNLAPENTLAAFRLAKAAGAKWIEFDVMLAACGEAVVIHDETLERTTNGAGHVHEQPYSHLGTLDAGSWFDPTFANERIPTFREVIEVVKEQGLFANVEIKPAPGLEELTVRKVISDIKKFWPADTAPPLISSFSMPVLRLVRKHAPSALIAVLIHDWFESWADCAREFSSISLNINHEILNAETKRVTKASGQFILCYTVNDPRRALELFSWGVDAVFTDNVGVILNAL